MSAAIGIDLGGTNIKAVLMDGAQGVAISKLALPTLDGEFVGELPKFALTIRDIVAELEAWAGQGALRVGLSAPGLADPSCRCIQWMPGRMQGLAGLDWAQFLQREVHVLNDAHAALLGEIWLGAAKGAQDVFMLTLGTGVGGAIVSGGRLLRGHIGRAGHLGHVTTDVHQPPDDFGTPGSLEAAIGNQTILQRGEGRYATTHALLDACSAGDSHALAVWEESVRHLAAAIAGFINVLDPEIILLGGGIATGAGGRLLTPLRTFLNDYEWRPGGHAARIELAQLGEEAGAYGAAFVTLPPLSVA